MAGRRSTPSTGRTLFDTSNGRALVKAAQRALLLHPDSLAPTKPGVETTKRILSNLSQLAIGVAELRNQYGPDHGRTTAVVGLRPRHAHLAVGAAATYCRMLPRDPRCSDRRDAVGHRPTQSFGIAGPAMDTLQTRGAS